MDESRYYLFDNVWPNSNPRYNVAANVQDRVGGQESLRQTHTSVSRVVKGAFKPRDETNSLMMIMMRLESWMEMGMVYHCTEWVLAVLETRDITYRDKLHTRSDLMGLAFHGIALDPT